MADSSQPQTIVSKKRYISAFTLLAIAMVTKQGQQQLTKFAPAALVHPVASFQYETGETPLTDWKWPVSLCCLYLITVFSLRQWMADKQPWNLTMLRVVHNFILCFGSLLMMLGLVKETYLVYQKWGEESLFCDPNRRQTEGSLFFWYYIFFLSKFYEFLDTVILVLRKKPLTFLHVFHHFITAFLCWLGLYSETAIQWIVVILNANVHIFMYYYYLLQTLGGDVWWKKYLTSAQIVQFVLDMTGMSVWWYYTLGLGMKCTGSIPVMMFTYSVLGSFLVLFVMFYRQTFKDSAKARPTQKREPAKSN